MGEPVRMQGWPKGVDNLRADWDIPDGFARDAVNVDILASGRVKRRPGIAQAIASAGAHSLFSDGPTRMVWATSTQLKIATPNLEVTTLLTDVRLASPLSYVALHGRIYFSNEDVNGVINEANEYEPWGITPPTAAPTLLATAGERYVMVTCTFVADTGEESGAPEASRVACTDSPVIQVTAIPQSTDARVVATRLYVTALNGTEFYAEVDVPAGLTSYTLTGYFGTGQRLSTMHMQPPPAGQLLEEHNGKIYIASGPNVFFTQPLRYGLYRPDEDYLMYPERVTLLKAVAAGLFVSADQTYLERAIGTPEVQHELAFPYKAIERAAVTFPNQKGVAWLSERGFVLAGDDGAAANVNDGGFIPDEVTSACMGVLEAGGHKRVVAIAEEGAASPMAAQDFENARIEAHAELA